MEAWKVRSVRSKILSISHAGLIKIICLVILAYRQEIFNHLPGFRIGPCKIEAFLFGFFPAQIKFDVALGVEVMERWLFCVIQSANCPNNVNGAGFFPRERLITMIS